MALVESILTKPIPPNPETSTPLDRRRFIVQWTRTYGRELALEDLLIRRPNKPALPEPPDPGDPLPEDLAEIWDCFDRREQLCINGSKLWRRPEANDAVRVACCIEIFKRHGLSLFRAIGLCRFPDGLGGKMPLHFDLLVTFWNLHEAEATPEFQHFCAVAEFALQCQCQASETAFVADAEWKAAQEYARNFMDQLRRRIWPLCRAEASEKEVLAKADQLVDDFKLFVPDELLFPVLQKIERGARPNKRRRRHV